MLPEIVELTVEATLEEGEVLLVRRLPLFSSSCRWISPACSTSGAPRDLVRGVRRAPDRARCSAPTSRGREDPSGVECGSTHDAETQDELEDDDDEEE